VTTESAAPEQQEQPTPKWKNPFVWGFVAGIVFLTALPLMQRRFLKAPPPIAPLGAWSLSTLDDARPFGSDQLSGKVFVTFFAAAPCEEGCVEAQRAFGRGLEHSDDLGDQVHFVTVARESVAPKLKGFARDRWHVLTGSDASLTPFVNSVHAAWFKFAGTDAGVSFDERVSLPAFMVVDQNGMVRGFWRDDSAGRGNAINAARLLAKYGPQP
jgi:cytochrome oxidase Cu insertion factor (SCO1/SenC/PrrC family)